MCIPRDMSGTGLQDLVLFGTAPKMQSTTLEPSLLDPTLLESLLVTSALPVLEFFVSAADTPGLLIPSALFTL